jgi:protein-tyrosine-phosphatase
VNPIAADLSKELGYDQSQLRSKSWDEFTLPDSPKMDFIITVCDQAAGEQCPYWPGQPVTAHWGFPDPSQVKGTLEERRNAFVHVMQGLRQRIDLLAQMPLDHLNALSLQEIHQQS